MTILLVRHAQSEWQLQPNDNYDTQLSSLGRVQADYLARWLRRSPLEVGALCSSPLKRATETISPVARALNMNILHCTSLQEADFHVADHLPRLASPLQNHCEYRPSAKYVALKQMAQEALSTLVDKATSGPGCVLAVSHGGLLKTLLRLVINSDTVCFRLYNAGISSIEWREGRWHLVYLNSMDHLPPDLRSV
jgi:broad specificity phosphatase PhoE